jgi:hypothetical protein
MKNGDIKKTQSIEQGEKIWVGEIDNAFVFTGYGDHHTGSNFLVEDVTSIELLLR